MDADTELPKDVVVELYVLCTEVVYSHKHTSMSSSYSSLHWVLSHWAHFTVPRLTVCMFLCYLVILHMCCIIVTWWSGSGGIEV